MNSDGLRGRIAQALGWSVSDATSFSLATLRDLVRPVSPKLAHEITTAMQHGVADCLRCRSANEHRGKH